MFAAITAEEGRFEPDQSSAFGADPEIAFSIFQEAADEIARQPFLSGPVQGRAIGLVKEQAAAVSSQPELAGARFLRAKNDPLGGRISPEIGNPFALIEPAHASVAHDPATAQLRGGQGLDAKIRFARPVPGGHEPSALPSRQLLVGADPQLMRRIGGQTLDSGSLQVPVRGEDSKLAGVEADQLPLKSQYPQGLIGRFGQRPARSGSGAAVGGRGGDEQVPLAPHQVPFLSPDPKRTPAALQQ